MRHTRILVAALLGSLITADVFPQEVEEAERAVAERERLHQQATAQVARLKGELDEIVTRQNRTAAELQAAADQEARQASKSAYELAVAQNEVTTAALRAAERDAEHARFALGLAKVNLNALKARPAPEPTPLDIAYVTSELTVLRLDPVTNSERVHELKPLEIVTIVETRSGWARVTAGPMKTTFEGWLRPNPENVLPDDFLSARMRAAKAAASWPLSVRLDIVRRRPRPGFTKKQILASQAVAGNFGGNPKLVRTLETAKGSAEAWIYDGLVVRFVGGLVSEIERISE